MYFLIIISFLLLFLCVNAASSSDQITDFFQGSNHTSNWAVLVCASRYWFNYRHMSNALGMYRTVKRLGIPDSNIILMLPDDTACNARNKYPGAVFHSAKRNLDLYGDNIEVDYRGYEVTVENLIRVLTGRHDPTVPRSKRLLSDSRSNIFVYMTGHGGNEFLKFQDNEEVSAHDLADAFEQMYQKKRYRELFFMIDTCQANTMYSKFYSPGILATGASKLDESSYSYENDPSLGVHVIDKYTHYVLEYMESINKTSPLTMADLFASYDIDKIGSHPGVRSDLYGRQLDDVPITDFFGGRGRVEVTEPSQDNNPSMLDEVSLSMDQEDATRLVVNESSEETQLLTNSPHSSSWLSERIRSWISLLLLAGVVASVVLTSSSPRKASVTGQKKKQ